MKTFCSYFNEGVCQSCELISLDYPDQIQLKERTLRNALAEISQVKLEKTSESRTSHFRNKAKLVVTGTLQNPILGLWGEENLDTGRELLACPLHVKSINAILPILKEFITLAKLEPYQIAAKKGELKGVILFHSEASNETYLRFVMRSKESIDRIKKNQSFLLNKCPDLKCLSVNIQPIAHAILEGDEEIFITSETAINHKLGALTFSVGPRAFVQTNQVVAEKLYQQAADWIRESGTEKFMELYCGQGAFSFFCSSVIKHGLGIEINPDAIIEAKKTAAKYNLSHLDFKSADASKIQDEMNSFNPDLILVNPPRRGLALATELLLTAAPKNIIYSSCNYETLILDLKKLKPSYEVLKVQIFDMFSHTKHFETLVLLKKKN
jgi:23S rRNA (uracil747-C5)-methyltransferase